ncbi:hypothetical protein FHR83_008522 [Actinoplanes campanulatus]|uniref:Uncharacterized protein n=1 Tax=Actinoplanes campanulatus TaxID=113559 RepID=A0A7W5FJM4_9ACTN|nr:hypothetical protein [Actinoplanes campanulatus]MBB3100796.1 hypothetical protein [Actinoplanes campanulatus]GGN46584.1 hypothetical protein GCM10010109_81880 [Actinoplanes campanulatus]GID41293.1 hypothetical protein Aca09nite_77990 [Actinoplanes campanulatus]
MGYPDSPIDPELFASDSNRPLPVGEVVEWFDFGQFVELYATDESGVTHPLVVTQDDAVLQASLRIREETGAPTRTVDLAGGVPLSRAVSGDGTEAFQAIGVPDQIVVDDVDELIRSGMLTGEGTQYFLTLHGGQITAIRDGEPQLLRARRVRDGRSSRVWLRLLPKVIDAPLIAADALDGLLALPELDVDGLRIRLALEPAEVAALLAGRTVVVRGTAGERTRLVRLRQQARLDVGFAVAPRDDQVTVPDLAAFLANPVVPGAGDLPYRVPLTGQVVQSLRANGTAQLMLASGRVLTLRVGKS